MAIEGSWAAMNHGLRNVGVPGAGSMAVAAVDIALWDLKAKLLGMSLVDLFGAVRPRCRSTAAADSPVTANKRLTEQLGGWAAQGHRPREDESRPRCEAPTCDAGASCAGSDRYRTSNYSSTPTVAIRASRRWRWPSDSPRIFKCRGSKSRGLRTIWKDCGCCAIAVRREWTSPPASMATRAGYFLRHAARPGPSIACRPMRRDAAVTRDFSRSPLLCDAFQMPLSAHCAPQLHAHIGCAVVLLAARRIFPRSQSDRSNAVRRRASNRATVRFIPTAAGRATVWCSSTSRR